MRGCHLRWLEKRDAARHHSLCSRTGDAHGQNGHNRVRVGAGSHLSQCGWVPTSRSAGSGPGLFTREIFRNFRCKFLQNTTHFHSRLYYVQGNTSRGTTGVPAMQDYDGTRDRRARKQEVTVRTGRMVTRLSCAGTVLRQPSGETVSLRRRTLVVFYRATLYRNARGMLYNNSLSPVALVISVTVAKHTSNPP